MRAWCSWGVFSAFLLVGCDSTFEPLENTKWVFSIAGHLDPSADTQWVRVNALRPVVGTSFAEIDAVVTLEEMVSGRVVVLTPSLGTYRPILQGGDAQYAFNFWTDEPIRPGASYRLTATRSDGASSWAEVAIPGDDFTMIYERWVADSRPFRDQVRVEGVPDLAMVLLSSSIVGECDYPGATFNDYQRLLVDPEEPNEPHLVQLDWSTRPSFLESPPECQLGRQRIVVIASGDRWPFTASSALRDLMHPNMVGNVVNGTGYLAGLLIRSFPRENCSLKLPLQEFCTVRYSLTSASLEGTVLAACTGAPVQGAQVILEEVTGNRLRGTMSSGSGAYRIEGLEVGLPYRLLVSHPVYATYESPTLTFGAAEERQGNTVSLFSGEGTSC